MNTPSPALVGTLIGLFILFCLAGVAIASAPLKPAVVERFERRQVLQITPANAAHVISAMTITHRWRRVGLVIGIGIGILWSLKDGALTFNLLAGLLGWFAGLAIAQWRIGTLTEPGERRAATLSSRSVTNYVTTPNLVLLGITILAVVVLAITSIVHAGYSTAWLGSMLYCVIVMGALALAARAVVNRPSGFVDDDVREADDALRGHSLTVLVGCAIALAYPPIWDFAVQTAYPDGVAYSMDPSWVFFILACVLIGWHVASASKSARALRKTR